MATYVVQFTSNREEAAVKGRRALMAAGLEESRAFRTRLEMALAESGLKEDVASFGEDLSLPVLIVTCTPRVAAFIGGLEGVEAVVQDSNDIGLLAL